ncbi:hypothetical protein V1478_010882 [Vespula squamosa]|uniref:Uncharacterized protein n=1 Tax=Vespula squamosa TaxID=30214 RepID=A0ABD2AIC9_VESSQ
MKDLSWNMYGQLCYTNYIANDTRDYEKRVKLFSCDVTYGLDNCKASINYRLDIVARGQLSYKELMTYYQQKFVGDDVFDHTLYVSRVELHALKYKTHHLQRPYVNKVIDVDASHVAVDTIVALRTLYCALLIYNINMFLYTRSTINSPLGRPLNDNCSSAQKLIDIYLYLLTSAWVAKNYWYLLRGCCYACEINLVFCQDLDMPIICHYYLYVRFSESHLV